MLQIDLLVKGYFCWWTLFCQNNISCTLVYYWNSVSCSQQVWLYIKLQSADNFVNHSVLCSVNTNISWTLVYYWSSAWILYLQLTVWLDIKFLQFYYMCNDFQIEYLVQQPQRGMSMMLLHSMLLMVQWKESMVCFCLVEIF